MKITYYGTAAAEGQPALFCLCPTCEYARSHGGKDVRTRSQALIDGELLIDFPADTYHHVLTHGLPLHKIRHCIVTHSHADHLYPADLEMISAGFANGRTEAFHLYGSAAVKRAVAEAVYHRDLEKQGRFFFHGLNPFTRYEIGRHTVIPLPARHDPTTIPYIYAIGNGEKWMLYGNDTGLLFDEVYDFLGREGIRFDFVSLDCTGGIREINYDSHMNFERNLATRDRLRAVGAADEKTVFCCHHFSHNGGHVLYDDFSERVAKESFLTSYDGMEYEF